MRGIISNIMASFVDMREPGNGCGGSKYGLDDSVGIMRLCIGGTGR